mmetsp:Transcript_12113/g.29790  ORF Transcript_12113/g.29790 Transcript_12113/m.29790 type:complete len:571 (-) Transcript_12113:330-2042(-)
MEAFKKAGGLCFKNKDFKGAVEQFTKAIELDGKNISLYGNRSVAFLKCGDHEKAIADADKCIKLDPNWAKGYVRKGNALLDLKAYEEAKKAYTEGLEKGPDANTLKQLNAGISAADKSLLGGMGNPFAKIFQGMWSKLAMNPDTRPYLDDPGVVAKLKELEKSKNPFAEKSLLQDPKMSKCLSVLFGIPMEFGAGASEGEFPNGDQPAKSAADEESPKPMEEEKKEVKSTLTAEEKKMIDVRAAANAEKEKGNNFYKKKKFDEALSSYDKAIEIDPTNCMYLSNKASVYMALKKFDLAIQACEDAFKLANERNADYKDKAKILTKLGKCFSKSGDHEKACEYYQKSLTEDYSDNADRLLRQTKDYIAKLKRKNYINPEKSQEHMEAGRKYAAEKKWRPAIEEFSEALKRDPKNYKALSNRAFIYSKVMDWNNALTDCEKCMTMAPDFVKIYVRKVKIEMFLKRFHKALKACNIGLKLPNITEKEKGEMATLKREVMYKVQMANMSSEPDKQRLEEAQKDPEIRNILNDPIIQKVLNEMKSDPAAAQRALADPGIAESLEMLMAAGVLRTG